MNDRARIWILLCGGGIYFVSFFQRVAVPGTLFNELQGAFALSAAGVSALGAIYLYIYGGMQVVTGVLSDRGGAGRIMLLSGLLLTVGSLLFPLSRSPAMLYGTRVLVGLGGSMIFISLTKEIHELFSEKDFPFYYGVAICLGYSGGLFATLPFERLARWQGWRPALFGMGLFSAAALACAAALLRKHRRLQGADGRSVWSSLATVLRNRAAVPLIVCGSINWSLYMLLQASLGKKLLQDLAGLSSARAAGFTFAMMLVSIAGTFFNGWLSRAWGRRRPFVWFSTVATLAGLGLLLAAVALRLPVGCFLAGYVVLGASASTSVIYGTCAKEINPPEVAATAVSVMNAVAYLGVAVVTTLGGLVLDLYRTSAAQTETAVLYPAAAYRTLLLLCLVPAVISFFTAFRVRETCRVRETVEPLG